MFPFISGDGGGKLSHAFGTRIQVAAGGGLGFTHVLNLNYTDGGTAHTITLMRGASRGKVVGAVPAGGTVVIVDTALVNGAGVAIAANDVVCFQLDNGLWHLSTVNAYTAATLSITLNTAVPTGRTILDGAKVVEYGAAGDALHSGQQYLSGAGSSAVNIPSVSGSVMSMCKATHREEPVVIDSNNATATGTLNYANVGQTLS